MENIKSDLSVDSRGCSGLLALSIIIIFNFITLHKKRDQTVEFEKAHFQKKWAKFQKNNTELLRTFSLTFDRERLLRNNRDIKNIAQHIYRIYSSIDFTNLEHSLDSDFCGVT